MAASEEFRASLASTSLAEVAQIDRDLDRGAGAPAD